MESRMDSLCCFYFVLTVFVSVLLGDVKCDAVCSDGECDGRRVRRSLGAQHTNCTGGRNTSEVLPDLQGFDAIITHNNYDNVTMENKQLFISTTANVSVSLCRGSSLGSPAVEAPGAVHGSVKAQRIECTSDASTMTSPDCTGCLEKQAEFSVSADLTCPNATNSSSDCPGLCLATTAMSKDLYRNRSTVCLTEVVRAQLYDLSGGQSLTNGTQMNVTFMVKHKARYQCQFWKDGDWQPDTCTTVYLWKREAFHYYHCLCPLIGTLCMSLPRTGGGGSDNTTSGEGGATQSPGGTTQSSGGGSTQSSGNSTHSGGTTQSPWGTTQSGGGGTTQFPGGTTQSGGGSTTQSSAGGPATTQPAPGTALFIQIHFSGKCEEIIDTPKEPKFLEDAKKNIVHMFNVQKDKIVNLRARCGSIIVEFAIKYDSPEALQGGSQIMAQVASTGYPPVTVDNQMFAFAKALSGPNPGNMTDVTPAPTTSGPTTIRYPLVFDYTPMMMAVAIVFACVVFFVCCSCIMHSWYLRKKKFTKYNSMSAKEYEQRQRAEERKKRLQETQENEYEMTAHNVKVAPEPPKFDMTNKRMPKVNETSFTNYDWAYTSHLPAMLARPSATENHYDVPRLILDSDSENEDNNGRIYENDPLPCTNTSHLSLDTASVHFSRRCSGASQGGLGPLGEPEPPAEDEYEDIIISDAPPGVPDYEAIPRSVSPRPGGTPDNPDPGYENLAGPQYDNVLKPPSPRPGTSSRPGTPKVGGAPKYENLEKEDPLEEYQKMMDKDKKRGQAYENMPPQDADQAYDNPITDDDEKPPATPKRPDTGGKATPKTPDTEGRPASQTSESRPPNSARKTANLSDLGVESFEDPDYEAVM
ncbi:uncharacterized protein LOC5512257 [Nematostella vectensis]|uniref:uncharacterized protein LOC5512257 n=1 Tax=Nematostella vectensis TaxID=45351 RepID=UPI002076EA69|nr:uncharacterized protein LOC5512257 [Nematostella vectensis]